MKSAIFWFFCSGASAATMNAITGIATFNNYSAQPATVCFGNSQAYLNKLPRGTFAAAIGDLSKDIWAGPKCSGSVDTSKCNGQNPISGYQGPACPTGNCGKCFRVCNQGPWSSGNRASGSGKCIKVQTVDACPAESAFNFCKTKVPIAERCGSSSNALDIDLPAYKGLTGQAWSGNQPNLKVSIQKMAC